MKSDEEIKQFVDSREVVTFNEVDRFMHDGRKTGTSSRRLTSWWNYALSTKDWVKMKAYRNKKIQTGHSNLALFEEISTIYNSDVRLRNLGYKSGKKFLEKVYKVEVPTSTYGAYLKKLKQTNDRA